jgi:riboflavin kinase/FMN adenylyltransferase
MNGSNDHERGATHLAAHSHGQCGSPGTRVVRGRVVAGARRGKQLGFPTANLQADPLDLPESGIYAAWVRIAGSGAWRPGAASVGFNPTFEIAERRLEVHILDYAGPELYSEMLEVLPAVYLRPEERYDSAEALARQIRKDCEEARRALAHCPAPS